MDHGSVQAIELFSGFAALIALIALIFAIYNRKFEARRRLELEVFAARHKFEFFYAEPSGCLLVGVGRSGDAEHGDELIEVLAEFKPFNRGDTPRADNVIAGQSGPYPFYAFDYSFMVGSGKDRRRHNFGIAVMRVPIRFDRISLRPENWLDRLGEAVSIQGVHFESEEFNRKYRVDASNERSAFEVVDPKMIEYLLRVPPRHWQLIGELFVVCTEVDELFSAVQLDEVMVDMAEFLERIPEFVRQDRGISNAAFEQPLWPLSL